MKRCVDEKFFFVPVTLADQSEFHAVVVNRMEQAEVCRQADFYGVFIIFSCLFLL